MKKKQNVKQNDLTSFQAQRSASSTTMRPPRITEPYLRIRLTSLAVLSDFEAFTTWAILAS
jgi:hypothetical protein